MEVKRLAIILFVGVSLVVMGMFVFAPFVVLAQETFTATITPPPGPGVTQVAPSAYPTDFTCPTGLPGGWGTVTPNPFWQVMCEGCIVPTMPSLPTITPGSGTQTQVALTGTPTATSIPSVTPTPQTYTIWAGNPTFAWTGSPYITGSHSGSCSGNPDGSVTCSGTVTFGDNSPNFPSNFTLTTSFEIDGVYNTPITLYYAASDDMQVWGFNGDDKFFWPASWGSVVWSSQTGSVEKPSMPSPYDTWTVQFARYSGAAEIFTGTYPYEFTISPIPIVVGGTPTPVPTTQAGYCGNVDGSPDNSFKFDGITFGDLYCVDLGPVSIEILGVGIEMPQIAHICFQDVSLGAITVFDISTSLDIIMIVFAAAWAVRNMFIS